MASGHQVATVKESCLERRAQKAHALADELLGIDLIALAVGELDVLPVALLEHNVLERAPAEHGVAQMGAGELAARERACLELTAADAHLAEIAVGELAAEEPTGADLRQFKVDLREARAGERGVGNGDEPQFQPGVAAGVAHAGHAGLRATSALAPFGVVLDQHKGRHRRFSSDFLNKETITEGNDIPPKIFTKTK